MEIRQVRAKRKHGHLRRSHRQSSCERAHLCALSAAFLHHLTPIHFVAPRPHNRLLAQPLPSCWTHARSLLSRTTTTTGWAHPAGNLERTAALLSLLSARRVLDRHNGDGSARAFDLLFVLFSSYAFSSFSSSSSSSYPSGLDDDLAAVNETLPDGWSAHHSDEGVFYHNESSGKVRRHLSLLQLLFSLFSNLLQQHFFWTSLLTTLEPHAYCAHHLQTLWVKPTADD